MSLTPLVLQTLDIIYLSEAFLKALFFYKKRTNNLIIFVLVKNIGCVVSLGGGGNL